MNNKTHLNLQSEVLSDGLDEPIADTNEFPVEAFPYQIQDIIRQTHLCSDYPVDYISGSLFFAASVAIGNTHSVEVKVNWEESAILFLSLVGSPGVNKTHPLSFAMEPLVDRDIQANVKYKKAMFEYNRIVEMSKQERVDNGILDIPPEPKCEKFIVSDITPESLISILEDNPRGIALYIDELASWFNNFNRYSKGSEEQFWLMAYSASPIQVTRKNLIGSLSIKKPFISVVGTLQPLLLQSLAEGSRSKNGFIDRILFVYPPKISKKYWGDMDLPSYVTDNWKSIINRLLMLEQSVDENGTAIPKKLRYSNQAWECLYAWHRHNTDLINDCEEDSIRGIYSKLEIYISRFSLILQLLRWCCEETNKDQIDLQSVEGAVLIVEYFRTTALRAQQTLKIDDLLVDVPPHLVKVFKALPSEFTTAEGVEIAQRLKMSRDSFNRFTKKYIGLLFDNYQRGKYRKIS